MSSRRDRRALLVEALQAGGDALMRTGDAEHARELYAEALRLMPAFRCNPDESTGLAEVVDLRDWSVRCE